jgi:hypothetical protein
MAMMGLKKGLSHVTAYSYITTLCFLLNPISSIAATFIPTTTNDGVDSFPGDSVCLTLSGQCTLRAAIQETNARRGHDTIILNPGTYRLDIPGRNENRSATGDLDILDDLTITGSDPSNTIIDAGRLDRVIQVNLLDYDEIRPNGSPIGAVCADSYGINVFLSNLTVQNGYIDNRWGGGIENFGLLNLDNVHVLDNVAYVHGGGISTNTIDAENCHSSQLLANNILVKGNRVLANTSGVVVFNRDRELGAGIYHEGYTPFPGLLLNNSRIQENTGSYGVSTGSDTIVQIIGTTIENNGGGLFSLSCISVTDSTIANNGPGRALEMQQDCIFPALFLNTTISGNTSLENDRWGRSGIYVSEWSNVDFEYVTIVDNQSLNGDALISAPDSCLASVGCGVRFKSTVISNTAGGTASYRECEGALIRSSGGNIDSDNTCHLDQPTDRPNTDPKVGSLANNGGRTQTHSLLADSPAIDLARGVCPATDQRGQPRPVDGNGDRLSYCDSGAYEFVPSDSPVYIPWIDWTAGITDLLCSLNDPILAFTQACRELDPLLTYVPLEGPLPVDCIADGPGCCILGGPGCFFLVRVNPAYWENRLLSFAMHSKVRIQFFTFNDGDIIPVDEPVNVKITQKDETYIYDVDTSTLNVGRLFLGIEFLN